MDNDEEIRCCFFVFKISLEKGRECYIAHMESAWQTFEYPISLTKYYYFYIYTTLV